MEYYRAVMNDDDRWLLSIDETVRDPSGAVIPAPTTFVRGERVRDPAPVRLRIRASGPAVDFDETSFGPIVISRRFGDVVESVASADVQRIPAVLDAPGEWEILNVTARLECIDRDRSMIVWYPEGSTRPGPPGVGKMRVNKLVIDADAARGHHLLRPAGWEVALVVSAVVKEAVERAGLTGVEFWPAS